MSRPYYGWTMVVIAALAMVGTLPGRSQGLGLVTEPLLADLRLDRVTYATINLWATLIGALGAVGIGRSLDRFGSRVVLTVVVIVLAVAVALMSGAATVVTLAVTLTATRALGQSALSVVSIAMVGHWFTRRINTAMAVYSVALSIGFMIAFPVVGSLVQAWGWRRAWLGIAIGLAVFAPIAWSLTRRNPESIGARPDGDTVDGLSRRPTGNELEGFAWTDAIRTGAFWIFAVGASLYGLVASGIGLFNESILAERGFNHDVYYQTLVVTAMVSLAGNFLGGWLASRIQLTRLMGIALVVLAAGVAAVPHLASFGAVMAWAAAMGLGGGIVMVLFFSVWPEVFGRRHLGRIQGMAQAMTVLASAVGPLLLAKCVELTGSYSGMFRILAAVIGLVAIASLLVRRPVSDGGTV
jgi:MFS family permease